MKTGIEKLLLLLQELEQQVPGFEKQQAAVSGASIGWHIEHSLLTIDAIIASLSNSNPANYTAKQSFGKWYVFTTRSIPRGRATSPPAVRPNGTISSQSLLSHLQRSKEKIQSLPGMDPGQYFEHPYFGNIKLLQAIRFLAIHTRHHIKIIRDINA